MGCTICSSQFTCNVNNRTEGVIGVQFVVGSIPHAGVFQDEVAGTCRRLDSVRCSAPCRAPHVVGFHPVAVSVVETNSHGRILADPVVLNRVPIALARVAIKNDAIGSVSADGGIGGVPIALALVAIKIDAGVSIPADGGIGNRVPIALAILVRKVDAIVARLTELVQ